MTTTFEPPVSDDRNADDDRDRATGAVSVRGRPVRKAPLAWLPWVALALLGVLLLAVLLVTTNLAAEDDAGAGDEVRGTTEAPAAAATGEPVALPMAPSELAAHAGRSVEGRGLHVQSVVADEGFWIGDDTTSRVFVVLTDEAKATDGESPFQVTAGQRVDLAGTVRPLPPDLPPFGLEPAEGAEQLRQQGHHIEATRITRSG